MLPMAAARAPKTTPAMRRRQACWRVRITARAQLGLGLHDGGGSSEAMRSSVQRLSGVSILLQVLLPERLLGAGDQGSHGGGVEFERGGDLLVGQTAAAEEQELGLASV